MSYLDQLRSALADIAHGDYDGACRRLGPICAGVPDSGLVAAIRAEIERQPIPDPYVAMETVPRPRERR